MVTLSAVIICALVGLVLVGLWTCTKFMQAEPLEPIAEPLFEKSNSNPLPYDFFSPAKPLSTDADSPFTSP